MARHTQETWNYEVKQGDTLSKIAAAHKLASWTDIYNHANNQTFRKDRPNANLIYPGDQIWVPLVQGKTESKPTDQTHQFVASSAKIKLQLRLIDGNHKPYKNTAYTIKIDGVDFPSGNTDGDGKLEIKDVPAKAGAAVLSYLGKTMILFIGVLDPLEENSGVKARLKNLNFIHADIEDTIDRPVPDNDPELVEGIRKFQSLYRPGKVDGVLDQETRNKLKSVYGC
jgi:hypothetical protein